MNVGELEASSIEPEPVFGVSAQVRAAGISTPFKRPSAASHAATASSTPQHANRMRGCKARETGGAGVSSRYMPS